MLNKDQYNQDAYNDVYAKATAGAEITYSKGEGGRSKLLLIFLLLALIGTLGYFVWKNLSSVQENSSKPAPSKEEVNTTEVKSKEIITDPIASEEESLEVALQKTLLAAEKEETPTETTSTVTEDSTTPKSSSSTADLITSIASQTSDTKMSPTDIARIVQLVTQQMQAEKKVEKNQEVESQKVQDSLEASLENVEIDTLSSQTLTVAPSDSSQKTEASSNSKTNTYNKVIVENSDTANNLTDELSQLSMEISNVINSDSEDTSSTKSTTSYTSSLSKEADTRTKEMRYHIVKKGDTLAAIAYKIYGSTKDYIKLYEANPDILRRADKIYIGQRLRVPE